jgi:hypothetical protein
MREILAASLVITLLSSVVLAKTDTSDRDVLKGPEAFGGWQKDKPGVRRLLNARRSAPSRQFDLKSCPDRKKVQALKANRP